MRRGTRLYSQVVEYYEVKDTPPPRESHNYVTGQLRAESVGSPVSVQQGAADLQAVHAFALLQALPFCWSQTQHSFLTAKTLFL